MGKHIFEEGPMRGHAAGDTSVEQQASQLVSDIKYKVRKKMKGTAGSNLSPAQVQGEYRKLFNASGASGAVKAIAKKKLFGEQIDYGIVPVAEHLESSRSDVFARIFEGADTKFVVKVVDKATGNTSYRKADRAKIAELRANKNIRSVEITGRKEPDDAYKGDPKPNYGGKKAKKDYDGDGKVESGSKEHAGVVHNAIQRKKGGVADGQDTRKEEYVDEGLRSAVKRLLGKKDASAEKKPESRGEQLRKKYNVGPERSDTSAKRQILDRTRAKAERDKKQYGGSVYTKRVADKSKAAHDRYLKGGYSKYGADDARGKGNKARRRAEALKKEDFNWLVDTLISEGYNLSSYTVDQFYDFCEEVIYEKEEGGSKKLDVMKGKNKVNVNPTIGESIRAELDALKAQKVEEAAAAAAAAGPTPEEKKQLQTEDMMLKKRIMMQMQKQGRLPLNYSESCDSEGPCEKCGKSPCECEKKEGEVKAMDPREVPTRINLAKNKLRAMGLKMSYDMEGEVIGEGLPAALAVGAGLAGLGYAAHKALSGSKKTGREVRQGTYDSGKNTLADKISNKNRQMKQLMNQSFEPEGEQLDERQDARNHPGIDTYVGAGERMKTLGRLVRSGQRATLDNIHRDTINQSNQNVVSGLAREVRSGLTRPSGMFDNFRKLKKLNNSFEPEGEMTEARKPEVEAQGKKIAGYEREGRAAGLVAKFRQENPGSRQAKKVPGVKETEGDAANRRRGAQAKRAAKHGLTSKERKESQARAQYDSPRD